MVKSSNESPLPCRSPTEGLYVGPYASPAACSQGKASFSIHPKAAYCDRAPAAQLDRIVEAAVRRVRCTGSISAI
jgi:hypothetical protein